MENVYTLMIWIIPENCDGVHKWLEEVRVFSTIDKAKEFVKRWIPNPDNLDPILGQLSAETICGTLFSDEDFGSCGWVAMFDGNGKRKGNIRIDIIEKPVDDFRDS